MPHVLVVGQLHASGRAILDATPDVSATYTDGPDESCYADLVHDADALLIRTQKVSAETVARAAQLGIVSRHGVGYDTVDVDALNARGIVLAICGDINSTTVAEHALMMILAASKRAIRADAAVRHDNWTWRNGLESQDLRRRNLLLVGYGRIGRRVGRMASGLEMNIRAHDPYLTAETWPDGDVTRAEDLHEALAWADVVSLSTPKTAQPLIGAREFAAMKDGTVLVNTGRGGTVDESALIDALTTGRIGAAGLDVFNDEPLPARHPLTAFDQVILSPHIAGVTAGSAERMAVDSARNIVDFFAGRLDPALIVNKARI